MANQKHSTHSPEDLKTDSIPDAPREIINDQETDASHTLPPKEEIINEERKASQKKPSTVVYQISNSNGIRIGPDVNLTIVQNSPSTKTQSAPKENRTIRGLQESKQQVTREHIRLVAPHVGEHWREVGRTLNLTDGRLEQIEQDHYKEGMREVVYQVLLEWIRVNASEARLGELTNALWKSAEYSAVKKLAEWAKESSLF
ncbi:receptor-interacting serine/threonine-protein kinase 1 isoform X2 [Zootermopsis nevadensis]|uniref:receptor-interacting serine/threonine-protein kinase 1 isoform X2 n=1 Tax=Zootermopsis nevadensis TaxID=136037 RepID=UPI000B8E258D|nr:receptor-interacting serine/threonine-protein kinase 1 isoform X2 [Zootermopsis nevadensis]